MGQGNGCGLLAFSYLQPGRTNEAGVGQVRWATGLLDCSALLGLDHGLGYLDTWLLGWATWRGYSTLLGYQATRLGWLLR